jgi:hypothetical protein
MCTLGAPVCCYGSVAADFFSRGVQEKDCAHVILADPCWLRRLCMSESSGVSSAQNKLGYTKAKRMISLRSIDLVERWI